MALAAAAAAPLMVLPAVGVPNALAESTFDFFPTEPTRVLTLSLLPGGNDDDLSGVMCQSPRTCQDVPYSRASSTAAVNTLDTALRDGTTGKQIVFAYSQGARVVGRWIVQNEGQPGAPTNADLSFVLMGNPARKYGGSDRDWDHTFPDSDYHVVDVSQQYDMASDFPDNPFNLLALLNANMAFFTTHQNYETVDIYDEANYVWTEGNITYVFVPTPNLPLLDPLRWIGLSGIADALNGPLKEIIERAYDRSYLPAAPGLPTAPAPDPELEPEEPQDSTAQSVSYIDATDEQMTQPPGTEDPGTEDHNLDDSALDDSTLDDSVLDEDAPEEVPDEHAGDDHDAVIDEVVDDVTDEVDEDTTDEDTTDGDTADGDTADGQDTGAPADGQDTGASDDGPGATDQ